MGHPMGSSMESPAMGETSHGMGVSWDAPWDLPWDVLWDMSHGTSHGMACRVT